MAKITKQAQEILCEIVNEKAAAKREELKQAREKAIKAKAEAVRTEVTAIRISVAAAFEEFAKKFEAALKKSHLAFCERSYGKYYATDLIHNGKVRDVADLISYFYSTDKSLGKPVADCDADLEAFDAKVSKCKRDIILRATLSGDYDEVLKLVDSISF